MSNPYGPPGQPPGYGPPGGQGGPPGGYGGPPGGQGGPPGGGYGGPPGGGYGGPPGGYGGPPGGYGGPPGYGPPGGYGGPPGYGPPGQGGPPQGPQTPPWVGWVARGFLALGILLTLGTVVGGIMSESLGVALAQAAGGPLGFGIVATLLTRDNSAGGAGKPLGLGCLAGFVLCLGIFIFFNAIWPSL